MIGVRYEMECTHTQYERTFPRTTMVCIRCGKPRGVVAIETREWHVKCNLCSFGRWCGQDELGARRIGRKHDSERHGSQSYTVAYQRNDASYVRLRKNFSRRVKWYIGVKDNKIPGPGRVQAMPQRPMFGPSTSNALGDKPPF